MYRLNLPPRKEKNFDFLTFIGATRESFLLASKGNLSEKIAKFDKPYEIAICKQGHATLTPFWRFLKYLGGKE